MVVINSSTFRTNQSKYFDLAAQGESVVVTRNNRPSVVVCAAVNFDATPKRDLTAGIADALNEVAAMRRGAIKSNSARDLLNEL